MCLCFARTHSFIRQPAHFAIIFAHPENLRKSLRNTCANMAPFAGWHAEKAIHSSVQQLQQLRHLFLFHAATVRIGLRTQSFSHRAAPFMTTTGSVGGNAFQYGQQRCRCTGRHRVMAAPCSSSWRSFTFVLGRKLFIFHFCSSVWSSVDTYSVSLLQMYRKVDAVDTIGNRTLIRVSIIRLIANR